MKFGLVPVNVGTPNLEFLVGLSKRSEEVGLESLWTFEHVIVPENYESKYPYSPTGKMGVSPDTNFIDPLIALTTVAAHTTRVKLATGVNILPQANPLLMAKQCASLDFVSGGRFMLGVGIGWLREEFDAMGVPFEKRGARFDDYLAAMRKVWAGEILDHTSEFLTWQGFRSHPKPTNLPVIIGGSKGKAFRRTALLGDGYFAPNQGVASMKDLVGQLRAACDEVGRDPKTLELTAMWAGPNMEGTDAIPQYAELGVTRLVTLLPLLGANPFEGLDKLGEIARQHA